MQSLQRKQPRALRKKRGQAMVEFMLVLPVLLLLLYGIIEVGRLIFIFASVANASRQAARYGSASGEINNVAFYQDCEGIREAAQQSAFIIVFDQINITYDRGVNADGTSIPIPGIDPNPRVDSCPITVPVRNGDRIIVMVSAIYEPILTMLPLDPMEIVSTSARSFLISVPIVGNALPTGFAPETSTPSPVPTVITDTLTPTSTATAKSATFPVNDMPLFSFCATLEMSRCSGSAGPSSCLAVTSDSPTCSVARVCLLVNGS